MAQLWNKQPKKDSYTMVAAKTCSSCKKLFDAKDIRNNLCAKCLATEVVRHWLKSDLERES